jgi:DnaJ-class molecular chaperone
MWQKCPSCNGTGFQYDGQKCTVCKGNKIINTITGLPPDINNSVSIKKDMADILRDNKYHTRNFK